MQVQFIDTRDGAEWMIRCAEAKVTGVRNMTGPLESLTMRGFLDACRTALNPSSRLVWLTEQFLLERGVKPWTEVPLWIPSSEQGLLAVAIDKAVASGLTFRPLAATLRDTLAWQASAEANRPLPERVTAGPRPQIGLLPERESALLAEWAASQAAPAAA
jgi:2'-hydroxyisoflavone reductase